MSHNTWFIHRFGVFFLSSQSSKTGKKTISQVHNKGFLNKTVPIFSAKSRENRSKRNKRTAIQKFESRYFV